MGKWNGQNGTQADETTWNLRLLCPQRPVPTSKTSQIELFDLTGRPCSDQTGLQLDKEWYTYMDAWCTHTVQAVEQCNSDLSYTFNMKMPTSLSPPLPTLTLMQIKKMHFGFMYISWEINVYYIYFVICVAWGSLHNLVLLCRVWKDE